MYVPQELVEEVQRCLDKVVLSRSCCMRRHHATSKELVTRTRGDLRRGLKKPDTGRSGMAPQEVLRSLVLMRVKNWDAELEGVAAAGSDNPITNFRPY